jgi:integrase
VPRIKGDTFAAVISSYLISPKFQSLAVTTQKSYRQYLKIAQAPEVLGACPVATVRPALIQRFLDGLASRPGAQMNARTALKAVEKWAVVRDLLPYPITTGTEIVGLSDGHHPWTDAQVECAERHARPDIAQIVTLAANTGQRGSDLIRMRWANIETVDGRPGINVTQRKTGLQLWVPFTQPLMAAIETWERRPAPILLKPDGQPYSNRNQLTQAWDRERDRNPQLAPCAGMVLHGLRATAVVRLRRAGATTPQIVDMVGLSAPMVERYSRFASQKESASAAVIHLDRREHQQNENENNLRPAFRK